jgi:flagellar protein FlgJ
MPMTTSINTAANFTDFQGLAELKAKAGEKEVSEDVIREAAAQFESIFIKMMLQSMREASPVEDEIFSSQAMEQYRDLMDHQLSMDLASKGGIGLADQLVAQMGGDPVIPVSSSGHLNILSQISQSAPVQKTMQVSTVQTEWSPDSPEAFIRDLLPGAGRAAERLGVPVEGIIAQAALETGWGKHQIRRPDGSSSFNLFGIKAGRGWEGDIARVSTLEFRDGIAQREMADFRAYSSIEESVEDYARFLSENPRYASALNEQDSTRFSKALQEAGYATDPDYARKIQSIMARPEFGDQIKALKLSGNMPIQG